MAHRGTAYFDGRGRFFRTAEEAAESDLSALLGRIGEGDSLAPGIAHMLLERRAEVEAIFADYDAMKNGEKRRRADVDFEAAMDSGKVTPMPSSKSA